jgi:hypothetical protein
VLSMKKLFRLERNEYTHSCFQANSVILSSKAFLSSVFFSFINFAVYVQFVFEIYMRELYNKAKAIVYLIHS